MRIYYVESSLSKINKDNPKKWDLHILKSLESLYDVISFSIENISIDQYDQDSTSLPAYYSEKILENMQKENKKKKINFFISSFSDSDIDLSLITQIKKMDIITININMDKYYGIHHSRQIASCFDYILISNEKFIQEVYAIHSTPIHLELAANPFYFYPQQMPKIYDVVFSGEWDLYRDEKLGFLFKNLGDKISLNVFGQNWEKNNLLDSLFIKILSKFNSIVPLKQRGKFLSYFEYASLFSQTKININISDKVVEGEHFDADNVISKVSLRDFEALMSGSFYITKYDSDLEKCFENYREIVFYSSYQELLDLIRFYYFNDNERYRIQKAGYKKALQEHTWYHRMNKMFKQIGKI